MIKKTALLALFVLSLLMLSGCDEVAVLNTSYVASVALPGNPSTGYEWMYAFSKEDIMKETGSEYVPDVEDETLAGSGGTYYWTFEPVKPGSVEVQYVYARTTGFEDKQTEQPDTYVTFLFTVGDGGTITFEETSGTLADVQDPVIMVKE